MQSKLSRLKIARYVVQSLRAGRNEVVMELAAYLVETKRTQEVDLIVREVDEQLERSGDVRVKVTTAGTLDDTLRAEIAKVIGAQSLQVEAVTDATILGGVKLETASRRLDATVAHRINMLRSARGLKV